jgi:hypothetical protein
MNCLAEERFVEILDGGGLDATRPDERAHLESCENCREAWATVAAAGEILAEARPKSARARLVPVMIAAAMLLTIVGVIVWKSSTAVEKPRDPIVMLLEGTPEDVQKAREALLKQGRKAIPMLVAARPKFKGSARFQALQDVIFDLKRAAVQQDPNAVEAFKRLESMKIDLSFDGTKFEDILSFLRDFSRLNFHLDPTIDAGIVDQFGVKDVSMRYCLEVLCAVKDLDFDYRYGIVFLSTPLRLWSQDPAVGIPTANAWETQILAGDDAAVAAKVRSIRITLDMQKAPLPAMADYLTEISGIPFKLDPSISNQTVTLHQQDVRLIQLLQLMTLPGGWDVRIADGAVHLVPRRP